MVGGDRLGHLRLDRGEILGREGPRQVEVVVEAVLDGRADAQAGIGEEREDGLGHHVRGGVAHRVDRGMGARVEQLVDRASLGGVEREVVLLACGRLGLCPQPWFTLPRNTKTSRPTGREVVLPLGPEVVGDTGLDQ